jgi:uncharacterized RDD family membrane protein YckC/Tfp pilus assembly major pilin PilA
MYCSNCGTELNPNQAVCAKCGTRVPFMTGQTAARAAVAAESATPFADFWVRLGAFIIDCILLTVLWFVLPLTVRAAGWPVWLGGLLPTVAFFLYYAVLESSSLQATVGKLALGIKVTDMQGERIGLGRALGRSLAHIISNFTFFIGYAVAGFTPKRQTLHDMIAGTLVVRKRSEPEEISTAGPAPSGGMGIAIAIVGAFFLIMFIGICAAIAIPAYQDYTIRAQITEGLNAAQAYKAAVADAYAGGTEFGAISTESLKLEAPTNLQYVDSMKVISGAIEIKYGKGANRLIHGGSLVLIPGSNGDHDVVWMCGRASVPAGVQPAVEDGAQYTSIPNKYLPSACRST